MTRPADRRAPGYDTDPVIRAVEDTIRAVGMYARTDHLAYAADVARAAETAIRAADEAIAVTSTSTPAVSSARVPGGTGGHADPVVSATIEALGSVDAYTRCYPDEYADEVALAIEWAVRVEDGAAEA